MPAQFYFFRGSYIGHTDNLYKDVENAVVRSRTQFYIPVLLLKNLPSWAKKNFLTSVFL